MKFETLIRRKRADFEFGAETTQMTALALFIILLAFFIMLSGLAGFSLRNSENALTSLREAFNVSNFVYQGGEGNGLRLMSLKREGQGTSLADMAGTFEHEVPGLKPTLVKRTGILQITLPASQFNQLLGIEKNDGIKTGIRQMAIFLKDSAHHDYQITLLVHQRSALFPSTQPTITETLIPLWMDRLVTAGFDINRLNMGVAAGRPGTVTLIVAPFGNAYKSSAFREENQR